MKRLGLISVFIIALLSGCKDKSGDGNGTFNEDMAAKQSLQGVWFNEESGDIAFRAEGDTIFFPNHSAVPLYFYVVGDTLTMTGGNDTKYVVKKLTDNLFIFVNQTGETVRLVKNNDKSYLKAFQPDTVMAINQQQLIKRDTVVYHNQDKYHCYIQVNPTSYKVLKSAYNDDGIEVATVFYDNILHVSVFQDATKIYSSNVVKQEFSELIPSSFLAQSVLSDISYEAIDDEGVHFFAYLGIPESSSNYLVEYVVTYEGKVLRRIKE